MLKVSSNACAHLSDLILKCLKFLEKSKESCCRHFSVLLMLSVHVADLQDRLMTGNQVVFDMVGGQCM